MKLPTEKRKCVVCEATYVCSVASTRQICSRDDCFIMLRTGKTMDELVYQESLMPRDIPNNNRDYEDFDVERMMSQRGEDER